MSGTADRASTRATMELLDDLARHSSEPDALTRLYLTPEHKAAALTVQGWMEQAGLMTAMDAAGTLVGRLDGTDPAAGTLILGSHIDTVRNAGRFDGNLGVAVAIAAVERLRARNVRLPHAIEVVAFGDEEGVRFPVTLTGSRALAGTFDRASLDRTDGHGTTLRDAMIAFGLEPEHVSTLARAPSEALGFIEVHIEQGPVLERENLPVGIVTAISGASRLRVVVDGEAGHAGTVPMHLRHDAYLAAAEMALAIEDVARRQPDLVATVGWVEVRPGAVNVIPGQTSFTLDVRSSDDAVRRDALGLLRRKADEIARRRGVRISMTSTYDEPAAACSPAIIAGLERAVEAAGVRPVRLPSGAGHDGLAMASLCQIGMLFVRCKGGISHNPAESVTAEDVGVAIDVLTRFIAEYRAVPRVRRQR